MNNMEYIRKSYNVPDKRGGRVKFRGNEGVIIGTKDAHLRVRFIGQRRAAILHPTWEIEYLEAADAQK
jgi:hypothetical protein